MAVVEKIKISPVDMKKRQQLKLEPGMTVRVWQKIQEKGKTRLQAYEGLVISCKHGAEAGATFTVRRVASGVGMEKIFPLYSPNIDKIEILRSAKVRRSKLYYIREKAAKEVRRRMKRGQVVTRTDEAGEAAPEIEEAAAEDIALAAEQAVEGELKAE